ncbi:hypothetical protein AgCh_012442 [Apium graveolens]
MSKHKSVGDLGFRNFRDFNLTMLSKQGWRILTNPESLVGKVYKAKYFENTDFLNSSLGHNPSFIWRYIHEAKKLLLEGLRWRIGTDGDGAPCWVKPLPNTVKVSVDTTIFETREEVGLGMVARDSAGDLIEVKSMIEHELVPLVLAESMAIKEALSWIDMMQWSKVQLESDCLAAVQNIRCKTLMRS